MNAGPFAGLGPMNMPFSVILSEAKIPVVGPAANVVLDASLALSMTSRGCHWQRSEESSQRLAHRETPREIE